MSTPAITPMHQRRNYKGTNGISSNGSSTSTTSAASSSMRSGPNSGNRFGGNGSGVDLEGGRRPGRGGGGLSSSDANASILEQQNNERINLLGEQVARLKGLTIEIGNEVREQNSLLDTMGDGFQNTRDMLTGSLRRIGTMLESGGAKHMLYMVAFAVAVMILLWILMKKGSKR